MTLLRETDDQDLESVVYIERVQQTYLHALGNRPRTVLAQILVGGVFWFSEINTGAFLIWIGFAVVTNGMLWVLEIQFRSVVLDFDSAHRWAAESHRRNAALNIPDMPSGSNPNWTKSRCQKCCRSQLH